MAETTLNLEYKRFVRSVSNGCARTKYSYLAMQTDLLSALKVAPWRPASCSANEVTTVVNKVTATDATRDESGSLTSRPTYTVYLDDRYDAFKQGGDAVSEDATFCGYAGMVAYRYKLPSGYTQNIKSLSLRVSAARYLRSGLRVAVVLSDSAMPESAWDTVRGDVHGAIVSGHTASESEGVISWGAGAQNSVNTLLESRAREDVLTFSATDYPSLGTSVRYDYLWVYASIEDYEDWWPLYDSRTPRYYSIEGSATIVGGSLAVTFSDTVTAPSVEWIAATMPENSCIIPDGLNGVSSISGWVQRWGNFVDGIHESNMYLPKLNGSLDSNAAQLVRFGEFPRKNAFSFSGVLSTEQSSARLPISEFGVFAAARNSFSWSEQSGKWTPSEVISFGSVSASVVTRSTLKSTSFFEDGASNFARLSLKFVTRVVPPGKSEYTRVKFECSPNSDSMVIGVNLWRTKSPDAAGPFGVAAMSALGSYQTLYTANASTVSADVSGDGTASSGITLNVSADLVGYVPVPDGDGSTRVSFGADLTAPVHPGEMLIFAPRIESIGRSENPFSVINPAVKLA